MATDALTRQRDLRRGIRLEYLTVGWNLLEGLIATRLEQFEQQRIVFEREGLAAAADTMRSVIAKGTASSIRQVIDGGIASEYELLRAKEARAASNEREIANAGLAGGVLALMVLGLGGGLLLYAFRDLRDSEQALRENEAFLASIFAENPDALLVVDRSGQIVRTNPQADQALANHARQLVRAMFDPGYRTVKEEVEQSIRALLPGGRACIGEVAHALGTNVRTLQRRLERENVAFSELLDQARMQQVRQHLASRHLRLTDIAQLLGYSSLASFSTWYRSRFNETPTRGRQQLQRQVPAREQRR